jgi:hypothetical protein
MTPTTYHIHRNNVLVASIIPSGNRQEAVMGVDVVTMSYQSKDYIEFLKGDTVQIGTQVFTLSAPAAFILDRKWNYELQFVSKAYKGNDAQMLGLDEDNNLTEYECYLTGDANAVVDLIVQNANRTGAGWVKGVVDATETLDFDFTGDTCNTALAKAADTFKTEFWWDNDTIHLTKKGADSGLSFRHGKGKGLTKLQQKNTGSKVVTRLHIYGSKQNLPTTYPGLSKRLRMPGGQKFIEDPAKVAKYGISEDTVVFEDVFPRRIGTITSVTNELTFSDSSIDFDLNVHLVDGVSAKVKFLTGQLAGYILEIKERGYNHATKTITVLVNKNEQAMVVPSANGLHPAVGDQYIFLDVIMPAVDIANAEAELLAKGQEAYAATSDPIVQYEAETDRRYLRTYDINIKLGDFVNIADPEAGIDKDIRVVSKRTNLQDPYDVTIELSETTSVANIVKELINDKAIQKAIKNTKATDIARQRLMWRTTAELSTMLDTLRGEMLLIVGEGGAYTTDIVVETNVGNNPSGLATSAGEVIQEEYIDNGGIWQVDASSVVLPDSGAYYVYIRASRVSNAASVVTSASKVGVESDPAFYHFPLGVLSSVIDGQRIFQTLQGWTRITANNIKTGRVEDVTGDNYFDLSAGTFNLGDEESGIDYGVTVPGKLSVRGEILATAAAFIDLMVQNIRTALTGKRVEITASDNNIKLFNSSNEEIVLIDDDAAIIGYRLNPDPPYNAIPIYGAGIMIGRVDNNTGSKYLSLAQNGIQTNGKITVGASGESEMDNLGITTPRVVTKNISVKTAVVSGGTFAITEETNIAVTGNASIILPDQPKDGRPIIINGFGASFQVKSPNRIIKDRGDNWAVNTYMTGISWGRTFTYFIDMNAWVCSGYLN